MKKVIFFILLFLSVTAVILSCKKNSIDKLAGTTICDTTNISYSHDLVPILQEYCYGCHGAGVSAAGGGIILEGYQNLVNYANNNDLQGDISFAPGYTGMPYGKPPMPSCELNKILAWVNQGINDN